jgi:diguanylate cyclase (GGDEF)-like protein
VVAVRASSGAAILTVLERRHRLPVAPVIVLSGAVAPAERAGLLRAGAHTCLPDPVHPGELLAAVDAALAVKRSREDEEPEGLTDSLTGLGNRRLGERELDLFVARSTRHGHALAVVMAGVDGLEGVAEAHGPEAADVVLREVGARLAYTLRSGDVIVRWAAGEFLMMLPDTDRDGTHRAAVRLRAAIAAAPVPAGDRSLDVRVSVGWADWHGEDPDEFKLRVDRSLRQARAAGGDAVRPELPAG